MRLITRGAAAWFDKVAAQCQNSRRLGRPRRKGLLKSSHLSPRVFRPRLLCSRLGSVR